MTRDEQIIATSKEYYEKPNLSMRVGFIDGAKWADENPQFSKEEFIEKACKWLENTIDDDVFVNCGSVIKIMPANEFVEYFRKAMEE